jgi:hypothetical protein
VATAAAAANSSLSGGGAIKTLAKLAAALSLSLVWCVGVCVCRGVCIFMNNFCPNYYLKAARRNHRTNANTRIHILYAWQGCCSAQMRPRLFWREVHATRPGITFNAGCTSAIHLSCPNTFCAARQLLIFPSIYYTLRAHTHEFSMAVNTNACIHMTRRPLRHGSSFRIVEVFKSGN